ncbi:putative toxin-antitoxin system toxin component, PIN family [Patescibacteria group bacterium]|nr:putative toxin-antitoxin system toxin component, PIN family [Patescibacteria group bacterium]
MKIVLDTNVYIASFLSKGLSSDILLLGKDKKIEVFTSAEILEEVERKLIDKFNVDKKRRQVFLDLAMRSAKIVFPSQKLEVIKIDPDDNKILECAVEAEASLIISMDKHLLKLKSYKNIGVVHPKTLTWILPKILKGD